MKPASSFAALALCLLVSGCGADEKVGEMKQAYDNMQSLAEAGEKMDEAQKRAEARVEERRKRGDTLAMPYQELQKYLPADVSGYTARDPEGQTTNVPGMSYSSARRSYTNADGESVNVTIVDYNAAVGMLGAYAMYAKAGFSSEDAHSITRSFDPGFEYSGGWEQYNKDSKTAEVHYILSDRFLVSVETPNKPDTQFAKDIASSMSLKELAAK